MCVGNQEKGYWNCFVIFAIVKSINSFCKKSLSKIMRANARLEAVKEWVDTVWVNNYFEKVYGQGQYLERELKPMT